jgi:hypothetical protein
VVGPCSARSCGCTASLVSRLAAMRVIKAALIGIWYLLALAGCLLRAAEIRERYGASSI